MPEEENTNTSNSKDIIAAIGGTIILLVIAIIIWKLFPPQPEDKEQNQPQLSAYEQCGDYDVRLTSTKRSNIKITRSRTKECYFDLEVNGTHADIIDYATVERLIDQLSDGNQTQINLVTQSENQLIDVSLDISSRFRQDGEKARATVVRQFQDWLSNQDLRSGDVVIARLMGSKSYEKREYRYAPCYQVKGSWIPQNSALYVNFLQSVSCDNNAQESIRNSDDIWSSLDDYWKKAFSGSSSAIEKQPDLRRQLSKISEDTSTLRLKSKQVVFLGPGSFSITSLYILPRNFCSPLDSINLIGLDYDDNLDNKDHQSEILTSVFKSCNIKDLVYNNNP